MKKVLLGLFLVMFAVTAVFSQSVPREGLVGEWLFEGNLKDTSGNANHCKNYNAKPTADRFGVDKKASDYNGYNAYAKVKGSDLFNFGKGAFSISVWVKCRKGYGSNGDVAFVDKYVSDSAYGWMAKMGSGGGRVALLTIESGDWEQTFSDESIPLDKWVHLVYVRDGQGNMKVYVNKKLFVDYKTSIRNVNSERNVEFGRAKTYGSYFDGSLDDIRIYNRALSKTEVDALYGENGWDR